MVRSLDATIKAAAKSLWLPECARWKYNKCHIKQVRFEGLVMHPAYLNAKTEPRVTRFRNKLFCSLRNISQYLQCKVFLIFKALTLVWFFAKT